MDRYRADGAEAETDSLYHWYYLSVLVEPGRKTDGVLKTHPEDVLAKPLIPAVCPKEVEKRRHKLEYINKAARSYHVVMHQVRRQFKKYWLKYVSVYPSGKAPHKLFHIFQYTCRGPTCI